MKFGAVIFDLDNTLIRTERIKQHFFTQLSCAGLSEARITDGYAKASQNMNGNNTFSRQHFSSVMNTPLSLDGISAPELQVPGATHALGHCIDRDIPTYILTLGVEQWQREKIALSGLSEYIHRGVELLCTTDTQAGKTSCVEQLLSIGKGDLPILLINDKPDETHMLLDQFSQMFALVREEPEDARYHGRYSTLARHPRVLHVMQTLELAPTYIS